MGMIDARAADFNNDGAMDIAWGSLNYDLVSARCGIKRLD